MRATVLLVSVISNTTDQGVYKNGLHWSNAQIASCSRYFSRTLFVSPSISPIASLLSLLNSSHLKSPVRSTIQAVLQSTPQPSCPSAAMAVESSRRTTLGGLPLSYISLGTVCWTLSPSYVIVLTIFHSSPSKMQRLYW